MLPSGQSGAKTSMSQQPFPTDLDATLDQDADERAASSALSADDDTPPRGLPGYRLHERVGRGTFGEVWRAEELNTGREVAIKVFAQHRGLDWPLLKREVGKLAQAATERRVVQLLEVGWDAEQPYYVMEYLEGGSLADRLRRDGPLEAGEAVRLFGQVVEGLVYLHGKAILHCDLKPANVLLDGRGEARLADFGQARLSNEEGPVGGTLFYLAPELARPGVRPEARGDVYALGAVLYAMLTGHPPYASESASRDLASTGTISERIERYRELVESEPFPDAHRRIPGVDGDLAAIVDRCLARDPEHRFKSAHEVQEALEARRRRRAQRPLLAFGLLGPLALLVVVAAVGFVAFEAAERQARRALLGQNLEGDRAMAAVTLAAVDRNLSAVQRRVEREAGHERLLTWMRGHHQRPRDAQEIQGHLQRLAEDFFDHYKDRSFYSWVIADRDGVALARAPYDAGVIGRRYVYREWFSGQAERAPEASAEIVEPRSETGLTLAFESTAEGRPTLISVASPIRGADGEILGVLAATLHLDTFNQWLESAEGEVEGGCPDRFVVLLHRDQLVRHPCPAAGAARPPLDRAGFAGTPEVAMLLERTESLEFVDPLGDGHSRLAVVERLEHNPEWRLLLLHDRDSVVSALGQLGRRLRLLGLVAVTLGLAVVVVLGLLLWRVLRWQASP